MELLEALGTITALEKECLSGRHFAKSLLQPARLACKDQRRKAFQLFLDCSKRGRIRIVFRNMLRWQLTPI